MVKYDVPAGWKQVNIGSVLKRVRNPVDVEPKLLYREIGIRSHGKGIFYKKENSGESLGNKSVFWVEPDCFVVNIVFAWEQAVAKTTANEKGMIASHRFPMYKPVNGKLDLDYILYFFKTPFGKHLLGLASPGGAGRNKTLGQQEFQKLSIPLPPYPEQRKIADILSTWDEAIARTERLIAALQHRKKGLMQRLLTGEIRFAGFEDEWEEARLQEVIEINYGKSPKDIRDENGKYPIFGTGGIVGHTNQPLCHQSSVIIGRKGSIDQPQLTLHPYWAIDTTFYCTPKSGLDVRWLYYFLSHKGLARYNEGSTIPSLSRTTLQKLKLRVPTPNEQNKIADLLQECDLEISLQHQRANAIKQQKKGLMQRLLSGQVRVKV
jgi:type I restriction enzyme, S subunit